MSHCLSPQLDPNKKLFVALITKNVEECVPLKGTNTRKNCIPVERRKLWKRHTKLSKQLVVEKNAIKMAKIIEERQKIESKLSQDYLEREEI